MSSNAPAHAGHRNGLRVLRILPALVLGMVLITTLVLSPGPARAQVPAAGVSPELEAVDAPPDEEQVEGDVLQNRAERPVVLIGVPGLAWEDITAATPNLLSLTGESVASLIVRSIRTTACPADGWLAISAGNRAGDLLGPCRTLTEPGDDGVARGWQDYVESAQERHESAVPGTFGQVLAAADVTAVGIGPGAAIALADPQGRPAVHYPRPNEAPEMVDLVASVIPGTDLLIVDAGALRPVPRERREEVTDETAPLLNPVDPEVHRADQLRLIDRRVGSIVQGLEAAGSDPVVMLAGLADDGSIGLRVLAVDDSEAPTGLGITASTRQSGLVMVTDLFPTLLSMLDVDTRSDIPGSTIGARLQIEPTEMNAAERREFLRDQDLKAQAVRPITPTYYLVLVVLNLVLFAALAVGLKRPLAERLRKFAQRRLPRLAKQLTAFTMNRRKVLGGMRIAALAVAALPVSSFLANLLPWWRVRPPALGIAATILMFVALIVAIAMIGPWRRHVLGAPTVVAAITAGMLTADIATGARLQVDAVMGVSTIVAGRMYGMNNTAFTLFIVSTMLITVTITNHLVLQGRRKVAGVIAAGIGLAATLFAGLPFLGADFGGPPALIPAYALLALMAAGVRLSVLRVAVVLGASALAALSFAFLDWLRPPEQHTHLGAFFQTVLDGGLWSVIARNAQANLGILVGNRPLTLLAVAGVLTVVFVFARPIRGAIREPGLPDSLSRGTPLSQMGQDAPMLPSGIIAIAVGLGIGMAVNDSGVAIPAVGVSVGVPLLVTASCTWMLTLTRHNGAHLGSTDQARRRESSSPTTQASTE